MNFEKEKQIRQALGETFGEARATELWHQMSTMPLGFRMQVIMEEVSKLPNDQKIAAFQRMHALKAPQQQQQLNQGLSFLQRIASQHNQCQSPQEQQQQQQQQQQGFALLQSLVANQQQQQKEQQKNQLEQGKEKEIKRFLTDEQIEMFKRDGYLVLRNVVPKELTRRARRTINACLGRGVDRSRVAEFGLLRGGQGWCPEAAKSASVMALFHDTDVKRAVDELVGSYWPVTKPQLALRFPGECALKTESVPGVAELRSMSASSSSASSSSSLLSNIASHVLGRVAGQGTDEDYYVPPNWQRGWHIDGVKDAQAGFVLQFSLLVGVFMSDCDEALSGNFTVYPGGHLALQRYALSRGDASEVLMRTDAKAALPDIAWPAEPTQVLASEGDVVLAHWLLPHLVAPNLSPDIRYCSYFRVASTEQVPGVFRPEAVEHVWHDFKPIHAINHN